MDDLRCAVFPNSSFQPNEVTFNALEFSDQRNLDPPGLPLLKRDVTDNGARDPKPLRNPAVNAAIKPRSFDSDSRCDKLAHAGSLTANLYIESPLRCQGKNVAEESAGTQPRWAKLIGELRVKYPTQAKMADALGVRQATVSEWMRGLYKPSSEQFVKMGIIAGPPLTWDFWEFAGFDRSKTLAAAREAGFKNIEPEIPATKGPAKFGLAVGGYRWSRSMADSAAIAILHDAAAAGTPRAIDAREVDSYLTVPRSLAPHPEKTICIPVSGDSMSPFLEEGYIVAVDVSQVDRKQLLNQMVVARDPEGGVTIKWLRKIDGDEALIAQHTSLRHPPVIISRKTDWEIIGRVIWWIGEPPRAKGKRQ